MENLSAWAEQNAAINHWLLVESMDTVPALALRTSVDRVGYVLSTPLRVGKRVGCIGVSLLYRLVRIYCHFSHNQGRAAAMRRIRDLLAYGVCTETGSGRWRFKPVTMTLHPGRLEPNCCGVHNESPYQAVAECEDDRVTHCVGQKLLRAGAYPYRNSPQAMGGWRRWYPAVGRRKWLGLCTRL
jgi:hypothetical protein